jgi:hypothetical protein
MIADRGAPGGAGPEDPRGAWVQPRCSGMTARPRRINSLATGKGGDDSFTPIWSHGSADLIPGIDASPSRAGLNWRWSRCGFLQLPQVRIIPLVVENESCRQSGTMKMPRARGACGRNFRWLHDRAGTAQTIPALPSTRRRRSRPRCPSPPSQHPAAGSR